MLTPQGQNLWVKLSQSVLAPAAPMPACCCHLKQAGWSLGPGRERHLKQAGWSLLPGRERQRLKLSQSVLAPVAPKLAPAAPKLAQGQRK